MPTENWGNAGEPWGKVLEELPPPTVNSFDPRITKENKGFYLCVVWFLGGITVSAVLGSIFLTYWGKAIPSALVAIGSVAVGALGAVFSKNS